MDAVNYALMRNYVDDTRYKRRIPATLPTGFTWTDNPLVGKVFTDGERNFWIEGFDVSAYAPTGKTYYVDIVNGSDSNDGLTRTTALKWPKTALAKSDIVVMLVAGGLYERNTIGAGGFDVNLKSLSLKALPGHDVTFSLHDSSATLTWTLEPTYTNTYKTTRSAVSRIFDAAFSTVDDDHTEFVTKASVVEVEANPGSMFISGSDLYIHTLDSRVPDLNIRPYFNNTHTVNFTEDDKTLYMEGIKFEGGSSVLFCSNTTGAGDTRVYAKDCWFKYGSSTTKDNINIDGLTHAYFQNCVAAQGWKDGFNYGTFNDVVVKSIEINCTGRDCGVITDSSCNGSTSHQGGKVIRVNGDYRRTYGGVVADTQLGTQSWNLGCVASESLAVSTPGLNSCFTSHFQAEVWLEGCVGYGSTNGIVIEDEATLHIRNSVLQGAESVDTGGTKEYY